MQPSSTTPPLSAEVARELDAAATKAGFKFIDAPVSGGQAGAENGVLTVMCGGAQDAYAGAEPIITGAYARMCKLLGPAGSGQLTKMVNQICIAGLVQGLSEGIHFAKKSGLDVAAVIETISKGAAQSWQMENRYKTMNEDKYDFGFAVEWMRKDLSISLAEARRNGANLPVTALVDQVLRRGREDGRQALGYIEPARAPESLTPHEVILPC
ncbi:3-hydroxyisobutyrate dehydrogenase-like beta-hydroxyacid dehydrogenase [Bradyrhizobium sp. GM7.3]